MAQRRKRNTSKATKAAQAAQPKGDGAKWVPDKIEQWQVARLKPADRNPRKHPKKQIEQLAERYKDVGFTKPMLIRHDGRIIAGHGRWEAAKLAGLKTVPVIVAPKHWTDDQCRAELLADNALGDGSKWDEEELGAELALLTAAGFDLKPLGFDPLKDAGEAAAPDASPQLEGLSYSVVVRCTGDDAVAKAADAEAHHRAPLRTALCDALTGGRGYWGFRLGDDPEAYWSKPAQTYTEAFCRARIGIRGCSLRWSWWSPCVVHDRTPSPLSLTERRKAEILPDPLAASATCAAVLSVRACERVGCGDCRDTQI